MANSADPDQFRSQLIRIYTVCKGRTYPGSAGLGLTWAFPPGVQTNAAPFVWRGPDSCNTELHLDITASVMHTETI